MTHVVSFKEHQLPGNVNTCELLLHSFVTNQWKKIGDV